MHEQPMSTLHSTQLTCPAHFIPVGPEPVQVIPNSRHPHWDEAFTLLVHYPEAQMLTCALYDWDQFNANDEIGRWAPTSRAGLSSHGATQAAASPVASSGWSCPSASCPGASRWTSGLM